MPSLLGRSARFVGGICTDGTLLHSYRRAPAIWRIPFQLPNSAQSRLCFQKRLGLGWRRFATVRVDKTHRCQMFLTMPEAREPRSVGTNSKFTLLRTP